MNNSQFGTASSLMKYDIAYQLCKAFNQPCWYVAMVTEPKEKNRANKNNTNYRVGSKNTALFNLCKKVFYSDESSLADITNYFRDEDVKIKIISYRLNQKLEHHRIGYLTYFVGKDRDTYFIESSQLIKSEANQVILLDPDTGIAKTTENQKGSLGNKFILTEEINFLLNQVTEESIVVVNQVMATSNYSLEKRILDLNAAVKGHVIVIADEVLQTGLVIITKSDGIRAEIVSRVYSYLSDYRFIKNSSRILLGFMKEEQVTIISVGNFISEDFEESIKTIIKQKDGGFAL
jgi:hypothetical protein